MKNTELNNCLTEDNVNVVSFGEYEDNDNVTIYSNHPEQFKEQILNNQRIVEFAKLLDFDAILFALHRDLKFKHNNNSESHLHLKIAQVRKFKSLITSHSKCSGDKK